MTSTKTIEATPHRVLLADDDHALRMLLGQILKTLGMKVTYAENGKRALDLFNAEPDAFDLIIADICMPELSGNALIRLIREQQPDLPIIAITGYADPALIAEVELYHAHLFEKPLRMHLLEDYINSLKAGH